MANTYTAVTKQDGGWWIGWIEEVPGVNCFETCFFSVGDSAEMKLLVFFRDFNYPQKS